MGMCRIMVVGRMHSRSLAYPYKGGSFELVFGVRIIGPLASGFYESQPE